MRATEPAQAIQRTVSPEWKEWSIAAVLSHTIGGVWGKPAGEGEIDVNVFRVTEFGKNTILKSESAAVRSITHRQLQSRRLEPGDILLEKSGGGPNTPVGRVVMVRESSTDLAVPTNFVQLLRPDDRVVLPAFLAWLLHWWHLNGTSESYQRATTNIRNLQTKAYLERVFALPPLGEQARIVAILDEGIAAIDAATANAEKNLNHAKELLKAERERTLCDSSNGWQSRTLGEFVEVKHGFGFKSEWFVDTADHVLLTPGNFFESGGYRDRGGKQKFYNGPIPDGFILSKGDLLLAMTEQAAGLLGSPMIVPHSDRFLHNQRLGLVRPLPGVPWVSSFFLHLFNTARFRGAVQQTASGLKVRHTSPRKLYEVCVQFPADAASQGSVARRLDEFATQCAALSGVQSHKLRALDDLRSALLSVAFSGELLDQPGREPLAVAL